MKRRNQTKMRLFGLYGSIAFPKISILFDYFKNSQNFETAAFRILMASVILSSLIFLSSPLRPDTNDFQLALQLSIVCNLLGLVALGSMWGIFEPTLLYPWRIITLLTILIVLVIAQAVAIFLADFLSE